MQTAAREIKIFTNNISMPQREKTKEVFKPRKMVACIVREAYTKIKNPEASQLFKTPGAKTTRKFCLAQEERVKLEKVVAKDLKKNTNKVIKKL